MLKIVIIVPEYNEGKRAVETVKKILRSTKNPVIVVDDGSIDTSYKLLRKQYKNNERIILRRHIINLGKGAAMKTGVELAWKLGFNAVIFIDADGQHNPKHLKMFENELIKNKVVFGFREFNKQMPFIRKYGNIFSLKLVDVIFNIKRKDLLCGYLGFRKEVYRDIEWNSPRYGIETEMATKIGKNKLSFSELKIDTIYLDKYKGVSMIDAIKILLKIPFWYFLK